MLQELHITNIAIIKELEIVFSPGLNVLTGETGAGKTIILNALGLILGSRSDFEIIRTGEKSGKVQAIISGHSPRFIQDKLRELGLEPDASGELIIIREIDSSGKSKAKVNGERILLGQLQDLTGNMIDIHSQHQHQSLLQPEFQLEILDGYAGLEDRLNRFSKLLTEYREIVRKIEKAEAEREQTLKQKEFFEFELKKIEDIAPEPGEDTRIKNELQVIKNSELLYEKISGSLDLLFDNETSIYNSVNSVILDNSRTSEIDDGIRECISRLREVQAEIKDISMFFRDYIKKLDFSPEHIEELNLRLSQLNDLKLRFKKDLDSILVYGEEVRERLVNLDDFEINIKNELLRRTELENELVSLALDISSLRKAAGERLCNEIEKGLEELNMTSAKMKIEVQPRLSETGLSIRGKRYEVTEKGIDNVNFLISPNKGEDLRSLEKIVSGGELSRIMLAIKDIFAEKNRVKILIFDEIDSGIGGKTAEVVGRKLKKLSRSVQVIVITHLPQIAKFADAHYLIEKREESGRTVTRINLLTEELRKLELARMLGGEKITDITLKHAEELLNEQPGKIKKGRK